MATGTMETRTGNSTPIDIEKRVFEFSLDDVEKRDGEPRTLVGHAAVFNKYTDIMYWQERVMPGAFKRSIKSDDVRALFNHNPDLIIGRNKAGTLELKEDDQGLLVRIFPPDTQFANDLIKLIERGDVSQMSFAFRIEKEKWEYGEKQEPDKRDIEEVRLFDVSPVTYPAYKETDISVRSFEAWKETLKQPIPEIYRLRQHFRKKEVYL